MIGFEGNKVFAAVLVAGIVAMLSGFIADGLVRAEDLTTDAVTIASAEGSAGAATAAKVEAPEPVLALIATADVAKGEKLSKACAACHSFDQGGPNKVGPNLFGVVGRSKGGAAGFEYSAALKAKGGAWSYSDLNHFLWKPKKFVDGTKMTFAGLKNPQDRADLMAWLRTLSPAPAALPSAGDIAAEAAELAPPVEQTPATPAPAAATTPEATPAAAPTAAPVEKPAE